MWLVFLLISFACIAAAPVTWGVVSAAAGNKRKVFIFKFLVTGVFGALICVFVPAHMVNSEASGAGAVRAIFLSLYNTIQTFAAGCDYSNIANSVDRCPDSFVSLYEAWTSVLFVVAPVCTFGVVLSLFKNVTAYLRYIFCFSGKIYIFSELNSKALALAKDIRDKETKTCIVFTGLDSKKEEDDDLTQKAREMGAICFSKDITDVKLMKRSHRIDMFFFMIGDDEFKNLDNCLKVHEQYKNRDLTHIYVFATKTETEVINSLEASKVRIRRINEIKAVVNRLFYENGTILFDTAAQTENGNKKISAVVVGMGRYGTEFVKTLAWYGQMDGYELEINAFDKDPDALSKFTALAPELMSETHNGVYVEGEAQYKITVHSGVAADTIDFAEKIGKITDATYVVVALGNDDLNIHVATQLRMYFERLKIKPVIQAIVYSTQQKQALTGLRNHKKQPYNITFIGDTEYTYTKDVIVDAVLEKDALAGHLGLRQEADFWSSEYNYRSSMALAIHKKARLHCKIPGAGKKEPTPAEEQILGPLEHRRWNAYMRSEGYIYSKSPDPRTRNDLAKMHHNLVTFQELDDDIRKIDITVGAQ